MARSLLASLFRCLVAHSGRKRGNRQTDLQTKYRNPRCACVPRVNTVEPPNNESFGTANIFIIWRFSLLRGTNVFKCMQMVLYIGKIEVFHYWEISLLIGGSTLIMYKVYITKYGST